MKNRALVLLAMLSLAHIAPRLGAQNSADSMPVAQQFEKLHFRSIGPAIMSGRIADIAVYEKNTSIWYAGAAHGGVWKTTSNGATFTPIFEDHGLMSIGDVDRLAVQPRLALGRHGRIEQPPEHVVGRRRVEVDRRRQDLPAHGLARLQAHQPHPHRSGERRRRARRGDRTAVRPGRRARRLQDDRRRPTWKRVLFVDDETGANDLVHVVHRSARRSTRRRISAAARRAA